MKKKSINERAIIGFDHGLPCRVKNMALGTQLRQKPRPSASVFVYWVPRAMFFTRHGRPWSNPTVWHLSAGRPVTDVRFYTNPTALSTTFEDLNVGCKMYTVLHLCIFFHHNKTHQKCYKIMLFIVISKHTKHMYFTVVSHEHRDRKHCQLHIPIVWGIRWTPRDSPHKGKATLVFWQHHPHKTNVFGKAMGKISRKS